MKTIILNNCPPQLRIILISIFILFAPNLKAQYGYFEQGYGGSKDEEAKDLLGKEVIRTTANGHEGAINLLHLPNGLYIATYILQAGSTTISGTQKLMISK